MQRALHGKFGARCRGVLGRLVIDQGGGGVAGGVRCRCSRGVVRTVLCAKGLYTSCGLSPVLPVTFFLNTEPACVLCVARVLLVVVFCVVLRALEPAKKQDG